MAAHIITRQSLVFCCKILNNPVPPRLCVKQTTQSLTLCVVNGARASSPGQDSPVHVPVERLTVSYSRSSGPGGQHVNKVNSKAEVRFHVLTADWIPEDVRRKILEKNRNRINKFGELLVTSELSRSQRTNLSDCLQKISHIITDASYRPPQPTEEDTALRAARLEQKDKERLKQKKITSNIKHSRKVGFD